MFSSGSSISSQSSSDSLTRHHDPPAGVSTNAIDTTGLEQGRSKSQGRTSSTANIMGIAGSHKNGYTADRAALHRSSSSGATPQGAERPFGHSHSFSQRSDEQSLAEFLRNGSDHSTRPDYSIQVRRMHLLAADRKRRLTSSEHESGRRRTVSGGFHSRDAGGQCRHLDGLRLPQRVHRQSRTNSIEAFRAPYLDLTSPNPPCPQLPVIRASGTRTYSSTGDYILPAWQPDSEASECPICGKAFTWRFRRHHCRKCGRVVCDACSPHRITIPRQFLVHPPEPYRPNSIVGMSSSAQVETIDLTDDQTVTSIDTVIPPAHPHQASNPALGGGEKARLCNPCVPDPQPNPHLQWSSPTLAPIRAKEDRPPPHPSASPVAPYHNAFPFTEGGVVRRERRQGMIVMSMSYRVSLICLLTWSSSPPTVQALLPWRHDLEKAQERGYHHMIASAIPWCPLTCKQFDLLNMRLTAAHSTCRAMFHKDAPLCLFPAACRQQDHHQ